MSMWSRGRCSRVIANTSMRHGVLPPRHSWYIHATRFWWVEVGGLMAVHWMALNFKRNLAFLNKIRIWRAALVYHTLRSRYQLRFALWSSTPLGITSVFSPELHLSFRLYTTSLPSAACFLTMHLFGTNGGAASLAFLTLSSYVHAQSNIVKFVSDRPLLQSWH